MVKLVQNPSLSADHKAKRYREIDTFYFFILPQAYLRTRGQVAAFCATVLQGPLRRAEGGLLH